MLNTDARPVVEGGVEKLVDFLFKSCLTFDDLAVKEFEEFVKPINPPIDCED